MNLYADLTYQHVFIPTSEESSSRKYFSLVWTLLGIAKLRITPYRPESDGIIECKQCKRYLLKKTGPTRMVLHVLMAYRATIHKITKCTPNLVMRGKEVPLPTNIVAGFPQNNHLLTNRPLAYVKWVRSVLEMSFSTLQKNLNSRFRKRI